MCEERIVGDSSHMQAVIVKERNGTLEPVKLNRPKPMAGQVLVRVMASGVNRIDTEIRQGRVTRAMHPLPAVLGIDMAGVVAAVGPGVASFDIGDEVYGVAGGVGGLQGTLAQFVTADADLVAIKPRNIGMREAAALPLSYICSYLGLVERARIHEGQTVLVQGGAGGVGHIAVQLALTKGAHVHATVSAADAAFVERLGAVPVDYRADSREAKLLELTGGEGFDIVMDTVGGSTLDESFRLVRRFGHVVSTVSWSCHSLVPLSLHEATVSGVYALSALLTGNFRERYGAMLRSATRLVEEGLMMPRVDMRRFGLCSAGVAYDAVASGTTSGKIVIDVS
jgi:NADPH2:quinone reductase